MTAHFFARPYPSANTILLDGPSPILVDPGHGPHLPALRDWLGARRPTLVVNTHWHTDHAGANHALQSEGLPIAASAGEAETVNRWDPDACRIHYLRQSIAPYRIDRPLHPGDILDTGATRWTVLALPGHTAAQLGLVDPESGTLVAGDALHDNDLGWLDLDADPAALDQAEATVDHIAALAPRRLLSGHGPEVVALAPALARARRRLRSWRDGPERIAWHACKRILTHALMTEDGIPRAKLIEFLLGSPWLHDQARRLGHTPEAFIPLLLADMLRGAARWEHDRLMPAGPYVSSPLR